MAAERRAVREAQASAHAISHHHNIKAARRAAEQNFVEEDRREALAAVAETRNHRGSQYPLCSYPPGRSARMNKGPSPPASRMTNGATANG
jgi:hypothetical protein